MTKHSFGGNWTLLKLELLERYLEFFNTALQRQPSVERPFDRVYIDAFAGTGDCEIKLGDGSLATISGSAKIALGVKPAFHQVHLIDLNPKHVAELRTLSGAAETRISVHEQDANLALTKVIDAINWRSTRGVLFLDPYGMAVRWETLQKIAGTKALDVWYLFPLSGVCRQAARDFDKVDESKAAALDSVLGTTAWRTEFYQLSTQDSLIEGSQKTVRFAESHQIASYVHTRLTNLFQGWVSPPIFLPESGAPIFALYFAVANPADAAVKLSKKAAEHLFAMLRNKKIGKLQEPNQVKTDSLF